MRSVPLSFCALALFGAVAAAPPPAMQAQSSARDRDARHSRNSRDDDDESRIDTTIALGKGGVVDLRLSSGDVHVTGWNRDDAHVVATSESRGVELDVASGRISLDAHGGGGDVTYELSVPLGTHVIVETASGDITIRGVQGETETRTASGDIEVSDVGRRFIFESISGDIHVRSVAGDARGTTVSGGVTIDHVQGDIDIGTTSGDVELPECTGKFVRIENVSGDITWAGTLDPAGRYDFTTHSGDLRLRFPGDARAQLAVETFSGDIDSEFPLVLKPGQTPARHSPKRLEFTLGGGGARVSIESFNGDITIERGTSRSGSDQE